MGLPSLRPSSCSYQSSIFTSSWVGVWERGLSFEPEYYQRLSQFSLSKMLASTPLFPRAWHFKSTSQTLITSKTRLANSTPHLSRALLDVLITGPACKLRKEDLVSLQLTRPHMSRILNSVFKTFISTSCRLLRLPSTVGTTDASIPQSRDPGGMESAFLSTLFEIIRWWYLEARMLPPSNVLLSHAASAAKSTARTQDGVLITLIALERKVAAT